MNDFQKKMKEKIKQYSNKEYLKEYTKKEFLTNDEDADIFLKISNKDELIDKRTMGHQVDLNPEVYEYLEEKSSMLENNIKINLHIVGANLTSEEEESVKHMFKEHYAIELYKVQKTHDKVRNKIITMLIFGIITFGLYIFLEEITQFNFIFEVFSFVFSFAIWEALAEIIFTLSDIKEEREAVTQNLLTTIIFE